MFTKFTLNEKCRIHSIAFYPVEIKSDQDTLYGPHYSSGNQHVVVFWKFNIGLRH
jgi:hypothetical protein